MSPVRKAILGSVVGAIVIALISCGGKRNLTPITPPPPAGPSNLGAFEQLNGTPYSQIADRKRYFETLIQTVSYAGDADLVSGTTTVYEVDRRNPSVPTLKPTGQSGNDAPRTTLVRMQGIVDSRTLAIRLQSPQRTLEYDFAPEITISGVRIFSTDTIALFKARSNSMEFLRVPVAPGAFSEMIQIQSAQQSPYALLVTKRGLSKRLPQPIPQQGPAPMQPAPGQPDPMLPPGMPPSLPGTQSGNPPQQIPTSPRSPQPSQGEMQGPQGEIPGGVYDF